MPPAETGTTRSPHWLAVLVLAIVTTVLVGAVAVLFGAERIPVGNIIHLLRGGPGNQAPDAIILWELRLPRVVLGMLVGGALAAAGTCLQAVFKNPMADPYVLGVSAGGALGAAAAICFGWQYHFLGLDAVPFFALVGALGASLMVYRLGQTAGRLDVGALLLSGIALSALLSALMSLITVIASDRDVVQAVYFWLLGGLYTASWRSSLQMLPYCIIGSFLLAAHTRELNALLLGDDSAHHLGIDVQRTKWILLLAVALLAGAAVSVSGIIGFVGLIAPHIVRLLVGPDHRILLPASAVAGGIFLVLCDTLARSVAPPREIPVGIFTAIVGVPFFLYLLRKARSTYF